jgi:hypothetical protein
LTPLFPFSSSSLQRVLVGDQCCNPSTTQLQVYILSPPSPTPPPLFFCSLLLSSSP